jgi:hypothetical protein
MGVSTEEADRQQFSKPEQNLKIQDPRPDKRPLVLFLKQKNTTNGKGWLRKSSVSKHKRWLSDLEMVPILLLSASH